MEQPYKTVRSKAEVVVGGLSPGEHPSITVVYDTVGKGGAARRFVRQISVSNPSLFQRLEKGVVKGDQIEVTTVTDWYDTGSITVVEDFRVSAGPDSEMLVNNGGVNIVHNDIREITFPPAKNVTAKAQK